MTRLTRRQMLWSGAAATLAAALPLSRKRAHASATGTRKNLIIVLAGGGWDTSYSIDPKLPGGGVDVPAGTIATHGNLDVLEDPSRPAIEAFFTRYAPITAVVRGISMPSVSHQACVQSILTGARNETSPDMASIVAHVHGPDLPIPYLVLGDSAFAGPYAASMGRVGATNQLVGLLDPASAYPVQGLASAFSPARIDEPAVRAYTVNRADRERAVRGAKGYNKRRVDDFVASLSRGDRLRALRGGLGTRGTQLDLNGQRQLALDVLATGVSQSIMMSSGVPWDTHDINAEQSASHNYLFGNLTALVDELVLRPGRQSGTTMLDDTVIAVVSEMGRTPKLNSGNGKDHWPVTSAMVIGGGVAGAKAYGGTTSTGEAELVDLTTGALSSTGRTIEPRHFTAGILSLCGVDPADHMPEAEVFDAFVA